MIDAGQHMVLGIPIRAIDYEGAVAQIAGAGKAGNALSVSALAVHGVMTGALDSTHRERLQSFEMLVPDGQPVRWALRWLHGVKLPDRVYGPNLMLRLCERAADENIPIYLYGSRPETLAALQQNLTQRFPKLVIAGSSPSKFRRLSAAESDEVANEIRNSGARLTFVGLGCPRQEVWVYEYRSKLSMPLVAVGAAFDFHASTLPQAPTWMQNRGLEWLYRLVQEPRRLWRRYLLLNPLYLTLLLLQACKVYPFRAADASIPVEEMRYG